MTVDRRPRRKLVVLGITVAAAAAAAVLAVTVLFSIRLDHPGPSGPQRSSSGTRPTTSPVTTACATGSLQLIGSTAFMPIAQAAAEEYRHECTGAHIGITGGDSDYGLTQVLDAVHNDSKQAGSMIAMYDGLPSATYTAGLRRDAIGVLIFSVVAHAGLFPGNITTDELRNIYVKHGEPGVIAVGRRAGSGSRKAFIEKVLKEDPGPPDPDSCPPPNGHISCTAGSTADVLNFVNGTPNAISYAEVYGPIVGFPNVSVLRIDNASPDNVRNGSYGFWAVEHLYAAMQPTALTKDFLDFLSHYIESHLPQDFIACTSAPRLEADC